MSAAGSSRSSGSILLSLALLLALLGFVLSTLCTEQIQLYRSTQQIREITAAQEHALGLLFRSLITSRDDDLSRTTHGEWRGKAVTVTAHLAKPAANRVLYELSDLFSEATDCPFSNLRSLSPVPAYLLRSPFAPVAVTHCQLNTLQETSSFRTTANIELRNLTTPEEGMVLISAGFIALSEQMVATGKNLIIAGGDIFIQEIRFREGENHLEIISLGGGVVVQQVSGTGTLSFDPLTHLSHPLNITKRDASVFLQKSTGWILGLSR
ncbi:hypothetical protein MRY87_00470 [bacterium]|nr:hypothetical protein [bacterium]